MPAPTVHSLRPSRVLHLEGAYETELSAATAAARADVLAIHLPPEVRSIPPHLVCLIRSSPGAVLLHRIGSQPRTQRAVLPLANGDSRPQPQQATAVEVQQQATAGLEAPPLPLSLPLRPLSPRRASAGEVALLPAGSSVDLSQGGSDVGDRSSSGTGVGDGGGEGMQSGLGSREGRITLAGAESEDYTAQLVHRSRQRAVELRVQKS